MRLICRNRIQAIPCYKKKKKLLDTPGAPFSMRPRVDRAIPDREKNNIKEGDGVFVIDVAKGSAAEEAGLQKGDFITKIIGVVINTGTEMVEKVAALRPDDRIDITYQRNGEEGNTSAILKGSSGMYASAKSETNEHLGASFENLDNADASKLNIEGGVVVKSLEQGVLSDQTRIKVGFIITRVNDTKVAYVDELRDAIKSAGNTVVISGMYRMPFAEAFAPNCHCRHFRRQKNA